MSGVGREDLAGKQIEDFQILRLLGRGGMGEVYLAMDTQLRCHRAIKRLLTTESLQEEGIRKEGRRTAALQHPNIVAAIRTFRKEPYGTFLVMEYVDGPNLRERMTSGFSEEEFLTIAVQIADALRAAHSNKLVHRDIKPENIMLTAEGRVKVCDFGLAVIKPSGDETLPSSFAVRAGTLNYMAPEVEGRHPFNGVADERSDIYSLGVVFYEMLTGENPNVIVRRDHKAPPPVHAFRSDLSDIVNGLIGRMLRVDPAERYQTAAELHQELHDRLAAIQAPVHNVFLLPFEGAQDRDQEALAAGLRAYVAGALAKIAGAGKVQITSLVEPGANKVRSVTDARVECGATEAVAIRLAVERGQVRGEIKLLNAADGSMLSQSNLVEDIHAPHLADRIARSIASIMNVKTPAAPSSHEDPVDPRVAELCTQGFGFLQDFDRIENLESAIFRFQEALSIDSSHAKAHAGLGHAFWLKYKNTVDKEWINQAREHCHTAILLDSRLPEAIACLGTIAQGTGDYHNAALAFERALQLDSMNDSYLAGIAAAYVGQQKPKAAEEALKKAISLRPHYWGVYHRLAVHHYTHGQLKEAEFYFKEALRRNPTSAREYSNLGGVYAEQDRWQEAKTALAKSMDLRPDFRAAGNLGTVCFYLGQFEEAAEHFRTAIRLGDDSHSSHGNLAAALQWQGQMSAALDEYRAAAAVARVQLTVNPKHGAVMLALAGYMAALGEKEESKSLLKQAEAFMPKSWQYWFNHAALHSCYFDDTATALASVAKAIDFGVSRMRLLRGPTMQKLHKEPRFHELLEQAGKSSAS